MKTILTGAVAVGNVTARALTFRTRIKEAYYYPNSAWYATLPGGSYQFLLEPGVRNFDTRVPKGHESNWVQTIPGKGWNVLFRLYGPLQPWFDKSWKLGGFEALK